MQYRPQPRTDRLEVDYAQWSIEELWQLATQMRVSGARSMSRRELIELFAVAPKPVRH